MVIVTQETVPGWHFDEASVPAGAGVLAARTVGQGSRRIYVASSKRTPPTTARSGPACR